MQAAGQVEEKPEKQLSNTALKKKASVLKGLRKMALLQTSSSSTNRLVVGQTKTQSRSSDHEQKSHIAVMKSIFDTLCAGSDINAKDIHGNTPLHVASKCMPPGMIIVTIPSQ